MHLTSKNLTDDDAGIIFDALTTYMRQCDDAPNPDARKYLDKLKSQVLDIRNRLKANQ